jgi:hypothetical protein
MQYPREWLDTLDLIRKAGGTDAVIAGGAVRDFLLGRPVKDIDVFLRSRGELEDERIVKAAYPNAGQLSEFDRAEYGIQMPELSSVWTNSDPDPFFGSEPVQLIFQNSDVTFTSLFQSFDYGLCRVGFDGSNVILTDDFVKDAFGMTMTLLHPTPNSAARYVRLCQKYPYHKLVKT